MQLIYAFQGDYTRTLLLTVDDGFDVQAWANDRQKYFRLLDIRKIMVDNYEI